MFDEINQRNIGEPKGIIRNRSAMQRGDIFRG